jgi:deoxyribose-phosphate aldolase
MERLVENLAKAIDHTLLKPEATSQDIDVLCQEALKHQFATVCVRPQFVLQARKLLEKSGVKTITVIDFPKGSASAQQKQAETLKALSDGAEEIDMVLNYEALKLKKYEQVLNEIIAVVQTSASVPVKVILETSELNHEEKVIACVLSRIAGAAFVKTSTGFTKSGATVDDIKLMRQTVGPKMGVKASGGVRTREDAIKMIQAGATRIGTSAGVSIVSGDVGKNTPAY